MPENFIYTVEFTQQSKENTSLIKHYLATYFSEKEVSHLYSLISEFEKSVVQFPLAFPKSDKKNLRKAVLSKEVSVYYLVSKTVITVVDILDNRWDAVSRLK